MIRSELIQRLAQDNPDLASREIERIVELFFGHITDTLATGGRVELRGFGVFSTRARSARTGRNPRTGDAVSIPEKRALHFRPGKELRDRLNAAR